MKKTIAFVILLVLLFTLCSCETYAYDGIEKIESLKNQTEYELNFYLLPSDDFLERFKYVDADYKYRAEYKTHISPGGIDRSFLFVEYEPEMYVQAKDFCLQKMMLSDTNILEYNGYTFIENYELEAKEHPDYKMHYFPHWFNMFAYNDANHRLVFIGLYTVEHNADDHQEVCDNWGNFVEYYFGDIYDWSIPDEKAEGTVLHEP